MNLEREMMLALQIEEHSMAIGFERLCYFKDEDTGFMPTSINKALETIVRRDTQTIREAMQLIVKYKRLGVKGFNADIKWLADEKYMTKESDRGQ